MSRGYHERVKAACDAAERAIWSTWLAKLPPSGWRGSFADLEAELFKVAKKLCPWNPLSPRGPTGVGQSVRKWDSLIRSAGWRVEYRRTRAEGRTVAISPARRNRAERAGEGRRH